MLQKGKIKKVLLFTAVVGLTAVLGACGQKGKSSAGKEEFKTSVKKKETTSTSTNQEVKKEVKNEEEKQEVTPVSTEKPKEEVVQRTKEMEDFIFIMKNGQEIQNKMGELTNDYFPLGYYLTEEDIEKSGFSADEADKVKLTLAFYGQLQEVKPGNKWLLEQYGEREIDSDELSSQFWAGSFASLEPELKPYLAQIRVRTKYKEDYPEDYQKKIAEVMNLDRILGKRNEMSAKWEEIKGEKADFGIQTANFTEEDVENTSYTREELEKIYVAFKIYDEMQKDVAGKQWLTENEVAENISTEVLREKLKKGAFTFIRRGYQEYL
ncbi:hypothetical protein SAMN02745116_01845 [Pilibacter termitis]|uniref:Uncharacterized protein n=1 Tax=Pilibacter termitis TaxID=263852 RepID=A0A1T4PMV9_9ENTE|nr:hypothetical protein [Pilibacter termitis]SJZ92228.1 hypothetical protein SAMN02745116_01845 [Pilibacter termitis]